MSFNRTTIQLLELIYEYPFQPNWFYVNRMGFTYAGLNPHFKILETRGIIKKSVRPEVGRPNAWYINA